VDGKPGLRPRSPQKVSNHTRNTRNGVVHAEAPNAALTRARAPHKAARTTSHEHLLPRANGRRGDESQQIAVWGLLY